MSNWNIPGRACHLIVLLLTVTSLVSCGPSTDLQRPKSTTAVVEMRIVLDETRCGVSCDSVDFESIELGKMKVLVRSTPDLVLKDGDITFIAPVRLSRLIADRPDLIVWSATFNLTLEAAARVEDLGQRLAPDEQILISANGKPLDITFSRLIGQIMRVGEFSSRDELVDALGAYAVVEEGSGEIVEVFSAEELAAQRQLGAELESSGRLLKAMEEVREAGADGRISKEDMMKRLEALRQSNNP